MNKARRGKGFISARIKRVKTYEMMPVALWINDYPIFFIEAHRHIPRDCRTGKFFISRIYAALDLYKQRFPSSETSSKITEISASIVEQAKEEIDHLLHHLTVVANKMLKAGMDITEIRNTCIEKKQIIILRDTFKR